MRQGGLIFASGRLRSKKETQNPAAPNVHHQNPQLPGYRDHLQTTCVELVPRVSP